MALAKGSQKKSKTIIAAIIEASSCPMSDHLLDIRSDHLLDIRAGELDDGETEVSVCTSGL